MKKLKCWYCGKKFELYTEVRFCSQSCYKAYSQKMECAVCEAEVDKIGDDYCGASCRRVGERQERLTARKLPGNTDNYSYAAHKHVYVLQGHRDGETWYYVGETSDVLKRIQDHLGCRSNCWRNHRINPVKVERLVPVSWKEDEMEVEADMRNEVAIEYETTNVRGS